MSEGLSKSLTIALYVLIGLSTIIAVVFYASSFGLSDLEIEQFYASSPVTNTIIYWCYALLGIGALIAIAFPISAIVKNPAGARSALIGVLAILAVFGLSYVLAGDEMLPEYEEFISGPAASKQVGMGLIAFYMLAIGAVGVTIYSGVAKIFK